MSQKTRTNDLAAQGREAAEASRGNGVDDANWLSQLLARASRDDEPGGAALIRSVAKVAEEAPPKRAIATKSGLQEAERKAYATLISAKELHNKLSVVVQDRKEDALQNSWPSPDAALDLVRKAAEALRVMEQRAAALESYALKVVKEAREELASVAAKASPIASAPSRPKRLRENFGHGFQPRKNARRTAKRVRGTPRRKSTTRRSGWRMSTASLPTRFLSRYGTSGANWPSRATSCPGSRASSRTDIRPEPSIRSKAKK